MPVHYTAARSKQWSLNNNMFFFTKPQSRYSWRHAPGSGLNWVPSNFTSTEQGCCKERFVPLCCAKQAEYVSTVCRLAWNRMADLLSLRGEKNTFACSRERRSNLAPANMTCSDCGIINEKLIWRGSKAEVRVRGAAGVTRSHSIWWDFCRFITLGATFVMQAAVRIWAGLGRQVYLEKSKEE